MNTAAQMRSGILEENKKSEQSSEGHLNDSFISNQNSWEGSSSGGQHRTTKEKMNWKNRREGNIWKWTDNK